MNRLSDKQIDRIISSAIQTRWLDGLGAIRAAIKQALAEERALNDAPRATQPKEKERRLLGAIAWACGINGDFEPPENSKGRYWWREELRRRAGVRYAQSLETGDPILVYQDEDTLGSNHE